MTLRNFAALALLHGLLTPVLTAGAALAHSFNLLIVVPDNAPVREDMRRAVFLAADERDGHPENHSDGHLGGLDVYVTLTSDLRDRAAWDEAQPDIVLDALFTPHVIYTNPVPEWLALYGFHLDLLDREAVLAAAADPTVPLFAERFRAATGRDPGPAASAAYLGARLVDLIVRPLDDAGDPGTLMEQLEALR